MWLESVFIISGIFIDAAFRCNAKQYTESQNLFSVRVILIMILSYLSNFCFQKEELFKAADENGDGVVSMDELAMLLAVQQEK